MPANEFKFALNGVLEAAEIRQEQWERVGNGVPPHDVVDELYEVAANLGVDGEENEAQSIAQEQGEMIANVRANAISKDTATTALCIWEAVMENARKPAYLRNRGVDLMYWLACDEEGNDLGTCVAREKAVELAPFFDAVWKQAQRRGFDDSFDWELVPHVMAIVASTYKGPDVLQIDDHAHLVADVFMAEYNY